MVVARRCGRFNGSNPGERLAMDTTAPTAPKQDSTRTFVIAFLAVLAGFALIGDWSGCSGSTSPKTHQKVP